MPKNMPFNIYKLALKCIEESILRSIGAVQLRLNPAHNIVAAEHICIYTRPYQPLVNPPPTSSIM